MLRRSASALAASISGINGAMVVAFASFFLAALVANYFLGAFAPVDFLAVYLVLAIFF